MEQGGKLTIIIRLNIVHSSFICLMTYHVSIVIEAYKTITLLPEYCAQEKNFLLTD